MMKNQIQEQINSEINEEIIDNEDYLFYKSLIPELTVEMFIEHEINIKEMFEYNPCENNDYDDDDY